MHDKIRMMHELCDTLTEELHELNEKIHRDGGMSAGDLETVDKLTHAIKSIKTTIAMMESDGVYSGGYIPHMGVYTDRGIDYRGRSYAQKRDSMGRYSRRGYSYTDGMESLLEEMRSMMGDLPEEKRHEVERFVNKMERM